MYGWNNFGSNNLMSRIDAASNMAYGANPPYTSEDFFEDFPQFKNENALSRFPFSMLTKFISMANASVAYDRYGESWSYCMGLYVAHFLTLFLAASQNSTTVPGLIAASAPPSIINSKSVGPVSAGYDTEAIVNDLQGFTAWKATTYGVQFATFAKIAGMGGTLIW